MLYTNKKLEVTEITKEFGSIKQVMLGEIGRGRKPLALCVPDDVNIIEKGMSMNLTITTTKRGTPRISKGNDESKMFLLLDSYGGYSRRGCGWFTVAKEHQQFFKVLKTGNGADGMAGRIGNWEVVLVEVPVDDNVKVLKIKYSGIYEQDNPYRYYIIVGKKLFIASTSNMTETLDEAEEHLGIDLGKDPREYEYVNLYD